MDYKTKADEELINILGKLHKGGIENLSESEKLMIRNIDVDAEYHKNMLLICKLIQSELSEDESMLAKIKKAMGEDNEALTPKQVHENREKEMRDFYQFDYI